MYTLSGTLVREARARARLTQRALAARAGTTQSVVGRLEAGIGNPRFDTVTRLLEAAGFRVRLELEPIVAGDPVVAAYRADVDRSILRENLSKTPEQRIRSLQALQSLAAEAHRAGERLRRGE